jgi:hypothetical protein
VATQTLVRRVDNLEQRVTRLEELPHRVDALTLQISQLRGEMRGEFSAVREEMAAGFAAVRGEMTTEFAAVRGEMATASAVRDSIGALSTQMQTGLAEVMAQARMLYEDRKTEQALIAEGRRPRRKPRQ